jgi:hypothetical protein
MTSRPTGGRKDLIGSLVPRAPCCPCSKLGCINEHAFSLMEPRTAIAVNPCGQHTTWGRSCGRYWNVVAIDGGPIHSRGYWRCQTPRNWSDTGPGLTSPLGTSINRHLLPIHGLLDIFVIFLATALHCAHFLALLALNEDMVIVYAYKRCRT